MGGHDYKDEAEVIYVNQRLPLDEQWRTHEALHELDDRKPDSRPGRSEETIEDHIHRIDKGINPRKCGVLEFFLPDD